jgi:hypothetical protein
MSTNEALSIEELIALNSCDAGCPVSGEVDPTETTKACPFYEYSHEIADGNRVDIEIFDCKNPAFIGEGEHAAGYILTKEIKLGIE